MKNEILDEIHKFSFPMQKMLLKEAGEGQVCSGTTHSIATICSTLTVQTYLSRIYIWCHQVNAWRTFQEVFEESGFEVYEGRKLVMVDVSE